MTEHGGTWIQSTSKRKEESIEGRERVKERRTNGERKRVRKGGETQGGRLNSL